MATESIQHPLVSVLITSYNREKYIGAAIESVLASTYTNFELIIVDDNSKDTTVDIAQSYAAKDNRVKVYRNEQNLGDYPNRNKAASYATGKYIKYVDADDYIYPWGLQLLVEMMEQFPGAGYGLCSLDPSLDKPFPFQLSPQEAYLYHYLGAGLFHKAPLSAIIKKEAFDKVEGFSGKRMVSDFEMWHRLSQQFPVVLMPQGIVWYRRHGEQEVKDYHKFLMDYESVIVQYLNDPQTPLSPEMRSKIITTQKKLNNKIIVQSLMQRKLQLAWVAYKKKQLY